MSKAEEALALFMDGCNCAQSVAAAFSDEMGMPQAQVKRLTIGFGAGVGRLREVCGAVSGMAFVISALYDEDRAGIYARIQEVAEPFRAKAGSVVCRELLGPESASTSPTPEARTAAYYESRPCPGLVQLAAGILEDYLAKNPPARQMEGADVAH